MFYSISDLAAANLSVSFRNIWWYLTIVVAGFVIHVIAGSQDSHSNWKMGRHDREETDPLWHAQVAASQNGWSNPQNTNLEPSSHWGDIGTLLCTWEVPFAWGGVNSQILSLPLLRSHGCPSLGHLVAGTEIFIHQLLRVSNPPPLAHQSSILLLSQKSGLRLRGDTALHCSPFSWEPGILIDKTSGVTSQPIPRSGKPTPSAIKSTMSYYPQPHPQLWHLY